MNSYIAACRVTLVCIFYSFKSGNASKPPRAAHQGQLQGSGAAAPCGFWGPLRRHLLARSVISDVPIVTSVCVQVKVDTIFFDVGAWVRRARQPFYWVMGDCTGRVWNHMRTDMWNDIRFSSIFGVSPVSVAQARGDWIC